MFVPFFLASLASRAFCNFGCRNAGILFCLVTGENAAADGKDADAPDAEDVNAAAAAAAAAVVVGTDFEASAGADNTVDDEMRKEEEEVEEIEEEAAADELSRIGCASVVDASSTQCSKKQ